MGPYRDSISLKKSPLLGLYTGSEAQLDLATVRYHALGAYAKSVYLVFCKGYNELNSVMDLVLFEDAMSHVCRINRILEVANTQIFAHRNST